MSKHEVINVKKPLKVVQVFRNASLFAKGEHLFKNSRDWLYWSEKKSASGYVKHRELYLPEKEAGFDDINRYSIVFLLDDFSEKEKDRLFDWKQTVNLFTQTSASVGLDFLQVRSADEIEIYFNGPKYPWYPKRKAAFQLCTLKKNKPVEIKLNGKSDGHHQRYYIEEQFIFEYLGEFSQLKILSDQELYPIKQVPLERKLIDLRELLW